MEHGISFHEQAVNPNKGRKSDVFVLDKFTGMRAYSNSSLRRCEQFVSDRHYFAGEPLTRYEICKDLAEFCWLQQIWGSENG